MEVSKITSMEVREGLASQRPPVPLGSRVRTIRTKRHQGSERHPERHQGSDLQEGGEGRGSSRALQLPCRLQPHLPRKEATPFSGNFQKTLQGSL